MSMARFLPLFVFPRRPMSRSAAVPGAILRSAAVFHQAGCVVADFDVHAAVEHDRNQTPAVRNR
jgi:hypothetical protein